MDVLVVGIIVLALYAIVRIFGALWAGLSGARYRAYRALARQYRGRYEHRGLVDPPTVSFGHNGSSVRVGLAPVVAGQPSMPRTRVVTRFAAGIPFRFELFPVQRPSPKQVPRGTRLVRMGDPVFDRHYVVRANDPEIAREFLNRDSARSAIEALRKLGPPGGILVSVNPERLLVQIDRNLGQSVSGLDSAVRESLVLHDLLRSKITERMAEGIAIVDVGASSPVEAGPPICKVCNEPIGPDEAKVICASCKTPHHRDCWTFVGACSIYGCQGKQCVSA
ncbi:RING finger protein [Tautonia rosea]|uniref:RING finger protein n=1 Tax=Tautonia rosea TaxID=2728037 RepID=UPI001474D274|nr:RING finger protein [Tautonia rosea]